MAPYLPEALEHLFDNRNPINAAAVQALLRAYGHPQAASWHQWQADFGRLPSARLLFARLATEAQEQEYTLIGDCRLTLGEPAGALQNLGAIEEAASRAASRGWPAEAAGFQLGPLVTLTRQTALLEELGRHARYYRYRLLGGAGQPCYLVNLVPRRLDELKALLGCIGRYQPLQASCPAATRLPATAAQDVAAHFQAARDCWI